MRKIVIAILLATSVFALTACNSNRYMSGKAAANAQIERDLKAIEDTRKALAALGADVGDPDDSFFAAALQPEENEEPESYDERGKNPYGGKYDAATVDIFIDMFKEKGLIGNYFSIPGYVEALRTFDDGLEYMILRVEYGYIAIAKLAVEKGWSKIKEGDTIEVYFKYIDFLQYDEYLDPYGEMPLGAYEYFEDYSFS